MKKVISTCIYCGCGCNLNYHVNKNKILKITGVPKDDISEGKPCIKGLTINEVYNKKRIKHPYVRENNEFIKTTWAHAIDVIYKKIKATKSKDIFVNGSGKITNEDNLLIKKIGTDIFKTNNIDSCCGRLCHVSTVKGIKDCFGASNLTKMTNLNKIDTLFIIGSNPAVTYPVFWNKVLKKKKKLKIISIQPILNITSKCTDSCLEVEPGTETAVLNGIIHYLIENKSFIEEAKQIRNYKKLETITKKYNPKYVSKICKIKEKDFLNICKLVAKSKKIGVFHGMNFTQHLNSLENIHSLLNLAILKNAFILTLRGEINVQGVGDVFASYPKLNGNLVKSLLINPCKVAFITEFNPAQSLPNLNKVHKNLKKIFLVYLGSYFNKTCNFADVILPIPALFESNGTITNGEQRIRKVTPVIKPKKTFLEIAKLFDKKFKSNIFKYKDEKNIFKEIIKTTPDYKGLNVDKIYSGIGQFARKKIEYNKFMPEPYKGKDDKRTKTYPLLLTTFREAHQFLTGEITSQSKTLTKLDKDKCHIYICKEDAKKLGLKDEDKIKVKSRVGEIDALTRISEKPPIGIVATRFHYKEMLVNMLFASQFDDVTFTPNYKAVAVKIEKRK